ncbi:MAG: MBOAT family O-acyltransferase [Anaerolineae bacterium]
MTFDLRAIAIFGLAALLYGLAPARWRGWLLLIGSVIAIYWLQPALPIRFSDFVLPTATLLLATATWWISRPIDQARPSRDDLITIAVMSLSVIGLSLFRFVDADYRLTPSRPPEPLHVIIALLIAALLFSVLAFLSKRLNRRHTATIAILIVVGLFALLKTEALATVIGGWWRDLTGQDTSLASTLDLNWLGFSYIAFRLIHTLRDRQTGQLPALSLREYITYAIFFPAITAGPIDRAERFAVDLRAVPTIKGFDAERWLSAGTRIAIGLLKKFVIADSLAQGLSLNSINAAQINNSIGLWILLYGYAFRLFFDFSGYTDIAIGLGQLFGVNLPDNFKRPYLKTNITAFWQSWHMTLSAWARAYVFSPLSRWLLMLKRRPSSTVIVLITQLATMIVIGLWHGVTLNFVVWGVWHGVALFAHKQWSDRTRKWWRGLQNKPRQKRAWTLFSWFVTFQYVVIGWLWFALPDVSQSARLMTRLFGIGW